MERTRPLRNKQTPGGAPIQKTALPFSARDAGKVKPAGQRRSTECIVNKLASVILFFVLAFFEAAGEAKVYFDVYGQPYKKFVIAVPPFAGAEKPRPEISDLLCRDLDFSGFFDVAPRSLMDSGMLGEGVDRDSIKFDRWRSLGVEFLCKALVKENGNDLTLEAYLYDTSDGTLSFAKRYRASPSEWRRVVHRLADEIIQAVTGEKGIMSSRVLFAAGKGRKRDVYVADLDGHGIRKLTDQRTIVVSPSVSPDGRYLAFTSYRHGQPDLYVFDLVTNDQVYSDRRGGTKVGSSWMDAHTVVYSHIFGKTSTIVAANVETKERRDLLRKEAILSLPRAQRRRKEDALRLRHARRGEHLHGRPGYRGYQEAHVFRQLQYRAGLLAERGLDRLRVEDGRGA